MSGESKYESIQRIAGAAIRSVGLDVRDCDVELLSMAVIDALRGIISDEYYPEWLES